MIYLYEMDLLTYRVGRKANQVLISYLVNFEYALSHILTFKHLLLLKILCPSAPLLCLGQPSLSVPTAALLRYNNSAIWSLSLSQPSLESPKLFP